MFIQSTATIFGVCAELSPARRGRDHHGKVGKYCERTCGSVMKDKVLSAGRTHSGNTRAQADAGL
jgi:hypothetical protein